MIPSRTIPSAVTSTTSAASIMAITAMPGRELAVDDVVAVDRLGEQPGQRALAALAVDAVEPERDPDERDEQRRERHGRHPADALRADHEQGEEQGGRAGQLGRRRC